MNKKNSKKSETPKSKKREICGIFIIALSIFLAVALVSHDPGDWPGSSRVFGEPSNNLIGRYGAFVSYYIFLAIGYTSYAFVALMFIAGGVVFLHKKLKILWEPALFLIITGFFIPLILTISVDIGTDNTIPTKGYSGFIGAYFAYIMVTYLGRIGTYLVSFAAVLTVVVLTTRLKPSTFVEFIIASFRPLVNLIADIIHKLKIQKQLYIR